jgi:beta-glucosidase-like glycosyl hydrolase
MRPARLLAPAIRWKDETGFSHEREAIDRALSLGVGGFVLFGGEAGAVRELTADLRRRSSVPLFIAADLERGAGQQFRGATQLPPLSASTGSWRLSPTWISSRTTRSSERGRSARTRRASPRTSRPGSKAAATKARAAARNISRVTVGPPTIRTNAVRSCARHGRSSSSI